MTTPYGFALKIETSWAKKVVKPSLETWNANDVIVYVWFICSRIKTKNKNKKICSVKKNNSKCSKFTIKNQKNWDLIQD